MYPATFARGNRVAVAGAELRRYDIEAIFA